jgi:hypothetical protein
MAPVSDLFLRWALRGSRVALVLLLAGLSTACSLFQSADPEEIRVLVEGTAGASVRVVVSREFFLSGAEGGEGVAVTFAASDTIAATLPFDRSFPLAPTFRFVARAYGPETGETVTVRMRVLVDGQQRYNQTGPVEENFLQFIYLFQ